MRFIFKTSYAQDIALARHGGHVFWYGLLGAVLIAAPWLLPEYWLAQLTFVLIYGIVGLGLMLLAGFTGQFSIGHAPSSVPVPTRRRCWPMRACPFPLRWPRRRRYRRRWAWWWGCRRCG